MSLKKQVKEQKLELSKKDEELHNAKKNIKNTKFYEMDQEIKMYKEELVRMRYLLEQSYSGNSGRLDESSPTSGRPSNMAFAHTQKNTSSPIGATTTQLQQMQAQNNSQPLFEFANSNGNSNAATTFKMANNSQPNFFPDSTSNLS